MSPPSTSSRRCPKTRSAARLNSVIRPSSPNVTIPSRAESRMAASRASLRRRPSPATVSSAVRCATRRSSASARRRCSSTRRASRKAMSAWFLATVSSSRSVSLGKSSRSEPATRMPRSPWRPTGKGTSDSSPRPTRRRRTWGQRPGSSSSQRSTIAPTASARPGSRRPGATRASSIGRPVVGSVSRRNARSSDSMSSMASSRLRPMSPGVGADPGGGQRDQADEIGDAALEALDLLGGGGTVELDGHGVKSPGANELERCDSVRPHAMVQPHRYHGLPIPSSNGYASDRAVVCPHRIGVGERQNGLHGDARRTPVLS